METGADTKCRFVDRVFYSGEEREFNFANMREAFVALALSIAPAGQNFKRGSPELTREGELVNAKWLPGLSISALRKPAPFPTANDAIQANNPS